MAQKVYKGTDPYVFVSYSHKDKEVVFEVINDLMLCACNIWYDTGIHSGEDRSGEIAEHLFNAECVLFMVTENSVNSEYVKDELTFAKTKNKKIYPVYLEQVTLPLSLELLLGRAQAISLSDDDIAESRFKLRDKIKNNLPTDVFQTIALSRLESNSPRVTLIDYKCVGDLGDKNRAFTDELIKEIKATFNA